MSRSEVLKLYKSLHRTIQRVFKGDHEAMFAARDKVCEEFGKYRNVTSENSVQALVNQGWEVEGILSKQIVQIQQVEGDKYQMNIREETHKFENNPFRDDVTPEEYKAANRKARRKGTCDDKAK